MDTFENVLGQFENSEVFPFFWNFSTSRPSRVHWTKNLEKSHQNMFGQSWKRFWTFLKIWILFDFCGTFSSLQGALGRVFFRRNNHATHDQTMFLGTFLENFESFEVFPLFCIFCEFRPPRVHWAEIFSRKIPQNKFGTCLETFKNVFGHFQEFNFFQFLFEFLISRVHW